jgi:hypothetical protein
MVWPPAAKYKTKISSTGTTLLAVATSFFNTHPPPQSCNAAQPILNTTTHRIRKIPQTFRNQQYHG